MTQEFASSLFSTGTCGRCSRLRFSSYEGQARFRGRAYGWIAVFIFLLGSGAVFAEEPAQLLSVTASINETGDSLYFSFRCDREPGLTPHFQMKDLTSLVVEFHDTRIKKPFAEPGSFPPVNGIIMTEEEVSEGVWLSKAQILLDGDVEYQFQRVREIITLGFSLTAEQREKIKQPLPLGVDAMQSELLSFVVEPMEHAVTVTLNFSKLPSSLFSYPMDTPERIVYEFSNTKPQSVGLQEFEIPLVASVVVEEGVDPQGTYTRFVIETKEKTEFSDIRLGDKLAVTLMPWDGKLDTTLQAAVPVAKPDKVKTPEKPKEKEKPIPAKEKKSTKKWIYISLGALAVTTGFASLVMSEILTPAEEDPPVPPAGGDGPPGFPED